MKEFERQRLKTFLDAKNRQELVQLVQELFERSQEVQDYFEVLITRDDRPFLKKAKEDIIKALYPDERGRGGLKIKDVDRAIRNFEFISPKLDSVVQLRLFALEEASGLADEYGGDFGDDYYIFFEDMFENLLQLLFQENKLGVYEHRIKSTIAGATDVYGHYDNLMDAYQEFYP